VSQGGTVSLTDDAVILVRSEQVSKACLEFLLSRHLIGGLNAAANLRCMFIPAKRPVLQRMIAGGAKNFFADDFFTR